MHWGVHVPLSTKQPYSQATIWATSWPDHRDEPSLQLRPVSTMIVHIRQRITRQRITRFCQRSTAIIMTMSGMSRNSWFQIVDSFGTVLYTINIPLCECWAAPRPTCCCPLWQAEVRRGEGDGGTVATLQNIFAGCNVRGLCTKADNFQVSDSLPSW